MTTYTVKFFNAADVEQDCAETETLDQALQVARQFMERRDDEGDFVEITRRHRHGHNGQDDEIRAPMEDRS